MSKNFELLNNKYYNEYYRCTSIFDCDHSWMPSCDVCSFYEMNPIKAIKSIEEAKKYIGEEFIIENPKTFEKANFILNKNYDFYYSVALNKKAVYCNISELKLGVDENLYMICDIDN